MDNKFTSRRTESYKKLLDKLPPDVQKLTQDTFLKWKNDSSSLVIKPLEQLQGAGYSAEINYRYRALAFKTKDEKGKEGYVWFWIGSHEDYNKVIQQQAVTQQIKKMRNRISTGPKPS